MSSGRSWSKRRKRRRRTRDRPGSGASLSRVSAYDWFGSLAFQPLGLAIWGPISVAIGIAPSLWLAAALMVATMFVLLAMPDIRRLPAIPESERMFV
jgi:hypothetical protein